MGRHGGIVAAFFMGSLGAWAATPLEPILAQLKNLDPVIQDQGIEALKKIPPLAKSDREGSNFAFYIRPELERIYAARPETQVSICDVIEAENIPYPSDHTRVLIPASTFPGAKKRWEKILLNRYRGDLVYLPSTSRALFDFHPNEAFPKDLALSMLRSSNRNIQKAGVIAIARAAKENPRSLPANLDGELIATNERDLKPHESVIAQDDMEGSEFRHESSLSHMQALSSLPILSRAGVETYATYASQVKTKTNIDQVGNALRTNPALSPVIDQLIERIGVNDLDTVFTNILPNALRDSGLNAERFKKLSDAYAGGTPEAQNDAANIFAGVRLTSEQAEAIRRLAEAKTPSFARKRILNALDAKLPISPADSVNGADTASCIKTL